MLLLRIGMALAVSLLIACGDSSNNAQEDNETMSKAALGEVLFSDVNLSLNRSQSCATCHDPEHAFIDPRDNGVGGAVSSGDDGVSLGDRNAPSAAYALLIPSFHINSDHGCSFQEDWSAECPHYGMSDGKNSSPRVIPPGRGGATRTRCGSS